MKELEEKREKKRQGRTIKLLITYAGKSKVQPELLHLTRDIVRRGLI